MNVFSSHFRELLSEALGRALVLSCENSALVVAATVHGFDHGQGIRTLKAVVENRQFLCIDSKNFRASVIEITELSTLDKILHDKALSGFLTYYATRLPIVISQKIKYKDRPRVHECYEILKTSLVTFEKTHPDVLDTAIRDGLFEDVFSVLRRTRQVFSPLRTSDDFSYNSAWLINIVLDTARLSVVDERDCSCAGLISSCIEASILRDCRVMAAAALCDIFPIFFNELLGHYTELLFLSPAVSEKPFCR